MMLSYLHHAGVCHGADVSKLLLVVGNLLEDSPHDLPGPGLGEPGRGLDEVRGGEGGDLLPDHGLQLGLPFIQTQKIGQNVSISVR